MKIYKYLFPAIILLLIALPAEAQKQKIKSIVVTQEKFNTLIPKKIKDYEVYYDEKGNIIEEINYKQGKIATHFKYEYDRDGNKIKEEEFDPNGKTIEISVYKIENGLRVEKTVYDANKRLKSKKYYQYTMY
ncbi:MAG: hypothetical protein ACUVTX_00480 [Bacteroidales bacterium]